MGKKIGEEGEWEELSDDREGGRKGGKEGG